MRARQSAGAFFLGSGRADFVNLLRGRILACPWENRLIFDSLVLVFETTSGHRDPSANSKMYLSQRKLNCALFVKDSLIKTFFQGSSEPRES